MFICVLVYHLYPTTLVPEMVHRPYITVINTRNHTATMKLDVFYPLSGVLRMLVRYAKMRVKWKKCS